MSTGKLILVGVISVIGFLLIGDKINDLVTHILVAAVIGLVVVFGAGIAIESSSVAIAIGKGAEAKSEHKTEIVNNLPQQSGNVYSDTEAAQWKRRRRS